MNMPFAHHPLAQSASRAGRAAYRRRWKAGDWFAFLGAAVILVPLGWRLGVWIMALIAVRG